MEILRARLALKYMFFEMLPSFILGNIVFVFILLMFQALRLTEFVLVHGVGFDIIGKIILFLSVSFLPVILPMSLLFSALLTYARMSQDSEILAFRSLGLNNFHLLVPVVVLAALATVLSGQISFYLAPWGNRQFELLVHQLGQNKATATIREGVFSEGFFDMVIYANKVDTKANRLKKVFIYDERDPKVPLTIIAKEAEIVPGQKHSDPTLLRLLDGDIHRTSGATYTKIRFKTHEISLFDDVNLGIREKSLPSFNIDELKALMNNPKFERKEILAYSVEYHRRWSLSVACFVFALLGFGLGTTTNRRTARSGGFVMCVGVIVAYWVVYILAEALAKKGFVPPFIAIWSVNIFFVMVAALAMRRSTT
jgi:lipopolysaccharide export system permease protein